MTFDVTGQILLDIFIDRVDSSRVDSCTRAILQFQKTWLYVEVDEDTDEVVLNVLDQYPGNLLTGMLVLSEHKEHFLFSLLEQELIWCWNLINNQGYHDGIQFQFRSNPFLSVQFLAIGSELEIRSLSPIDLPTS